MQAVSPEKTPGKIEIRNSPSRPAAGTPPPQPGCEVRRQNLLSQIGEENFDGLLVTHPPHLHYLFGFSGSTGLALCSADGNWLLVDSRYAEQAADETRSCQVEVSAGGAEEALKTVLERRRGRAKLRLGFESRYVSHDQLRRLRSLENSPRWVPSLDLVEDLRLVKDEHEIALLEHAFEIANRAYSRLAAMLRPGITESDAAGWLELEMRKLGGEGAAFDTIVASGPRSSLPHGRATQRRIEEGEIVLIDFGTRYRGYHSDMTRVLCPEPRPDIYRIVEEAQQAALDAIRPDASSREVDGAARAVIEKAGHGDHFGHGTGHGLGLEIHEGPRLSPLFDEPIRTGMVFTVEPGIYLPGRYGVRLEDAVVVTDDGYRLLSRG